MTDATIIEIVKAVCLTIGICVMIWGFTKL